MGISYKISVPQDEPFNEGAYIAFIETCNRQYKPPLDLLVVVK